ncbi:MAG: hypothetical protein U1E76_07135 [Planctomycetota bacterium]
MTRITVRLIGASLAVGFSITAPGPAAAHDFQVGDVICGVTSGNYQIYTNAGSYIETVYDGLGGVTTGAYFLDDPSDPPGRLYLTDFSFGNVVVLDGATGHSVVQTIDTSSGGGWFCESIVFDAEDNFYVGHAAGDQDIQKYDPAGSYLGDFDVAIGPAGSDWIDLACDQTTIYYTSEGPAVLRYDVSTSTQLADFATGLPSDSFALRLLPPFDGASGLIVANRMSILRLDGTGSIVQVYDVPGEDFWFSVNLDPNGTSFWSGDLGTANFYRFDIATGALEVGPINTGTGYGTLTGMAVVGEPTGGSNDAPIFEQAPCGEVINIAAGASYSYVVSCVDPDPGDSITLTASGVPAGATHTPSLPLVGAPDEDLTPVFDWTPGVADVGSYTILYSLTDVKGATADCKVTLNVAESYLIVGAAPGTDSFSAGGHTFTTQISSLRQWFVATPQSTPAFDAPALGKEHSVPRPLGGRAMLSDRFCVQALMYDPARFPDNPEQFSGGLLVTVWNSGQVTAEPYGQRDGMQLRLDVFVGDDGARYYRFLISVDGT